MSIRMPVPLAPASFDQDAPGDHPPEILVALDGSSFAESALRHARPVARALGSRFHLLAVLDPGRSGGTSRTSPECRLQLLELEGYLDQMQEDLLADGFEVSREVREGTPAGEIVRAAGEREAAVVALAARPRRRAERLRSRGVAQRVIASGVTSLLIARGSGWPSVRSGGRSDCRRLAVAVDGSGACYRVLRLAAALARAGEAEPARGGGAELLLIHVLPPEAPVRLPRGDARWSGSRGTRGMDPLRAERYLERLGRAVAGPRLEVRSSLRRAGDVAGAVVETAVEAGTEMLLLGAHGAGDAPGRYGRCSRNLLIHGDLPLLVVQDQPIRVGCSVSGLARFRRSNPPPRAGRSSRSRKRRGDTGDARRGSTHQNG